MPRGPLRSALRQRAVVALLGALVATALAIGAAPAPAGAHATLQSTSPTDDSVVDAAPAEVVLTFDEPVTAPTGSVQVISPGGGRADRTIDARDGGRSQAVGVDGGAVGTYTVAYRVVSDDGHTISGSFVFHVQERTGAASIDQSIPLTTSATGGIGRWAGYAGAVLAVGAMVLLVALVRAGSDRPVVEALGALVAGGAVASAVGTGLAVLAQTATTTGRSLPDAASLVVDLAGESRPLAVALVRCAVVSVGAVVAVVGWRLRSPSALAIAGVVVAVGTLLAPVAGHPWTSDQRALAVVADGLHLLAAAVWLGMVAALGVVAGRLDDPRPAIRTVSGAALVAAVVVGVTGAASGWLLLGSLDGLLQTASGQLVLLKAIGFATLVCLGWINRSRLIPLLADLVTVRPEAPPADDPAPGDTAAEDARVTASLALRRLVQVVRLEVVVGALVLAATAGLVNQPPGRDQLAEPYAEVVTVDGLEILLEVDPAQVGVNEVHVYATDADGQPAAVDAFEITVAQAGIPERRLTVEQVSPDHALAVGASLPTAGTWTIVVTTVEVGTPRQHTFEVPVS